MSTARRATTDLAGHLIILTAHRRATDIGEAFERRGAQVDYTPTLSVVPHVDDPELIARTRELIALKPAIVIITTGVGLRGWVEAAQVAGIEPELLALLGHARLLVRGPKALGAVRALGLSADWVAASETNAEIRDLLLAEGVSGTSIAIQYHGGGAGELDGALAQAGALVTGLVVYRWIPAPDSAAVARSIGLVAQRAVDAVVFTAAPGTAAFVEAAQTAGLLDDVVAAFTAPNGVLAAAVGPTTAAPLRAVGAHPLVPDRFRVGPLIRAVVEELARRDGQDVSTPAGRLRITRAAALLNGRLLTLSPASLEILRALAQAQGAVVSRADLLAVLPGDSSREHATESAIARLRASLGEAQIVSTVVKRGYRLEVADAP
ncbi:MAG: uroporphyrinogen-III synthase [Propioniciclava sp.]